LKVFLPQENFNKGYLQASRLKKKKKKKKKILFRFSSAEIGGDFLRKRRLAGCCDGVYSR
jgi:hypothetical protein